MAGSSESKDLRIVRVDCDEEGFNDHWIEFDTTAWTVREFREIPSTIQSRTLAKYVEPYSSAWNIKGTDGKAVKHPGKGATQTAWLEAYGRMDWELADWLATSPYLALVELMNPSFKSKSGSKTGGDKE